MFLLYFLLVFLHATKSGFVYTYLQYHRFSERHFWSFLTDSLMHRMDVQPILSIKVIIISTMLNLWWRFWRTRWRWWYVYTDLNQYPAWCQKCSNVSLNSLSQSYEKGVGVLKAYSHLTSAFASPSKFNILLNATQTQMQRMGSGSVHTKRQC